MRLRIISSKISAKKGLPLRLMQLENRIAPAIFNVTNAIASFALCRSQICLVLAAGFFATAAQAQPIMS